MADRGEGRRERIDRVEGAREQGQAAPPRNCRPPRHDRISPPRSRSDRPRKPSIMLPISPNQSTAQRCRGTTWTPGQSSIASQTARPTRKARVTEAPISPAISSADRQRRHQIIDDRPLDLADQQREGAVGERVLDHPHDDQARSEEIGEGHAHHGPPRTAQRDGEDDQEQQGGDGRRPDRLQLDLEETPHLLHIEGRKAAPIDVPDHRDARGGPNPIRRLVAHRRRR